MNFSQKFYLVVALIALLIVGSGLIKAVPDTKSIPLETTAPENRTSVELTAREEEIPAVVEPETRADTESPVFPALPAGSQVKSPIELLNDSLKVLKAALNELQAKTAPEPPPFVAIYHTGRVIVDYEKRTADILYQCDSECFLIDRLSGDLLRPEPLLGEGRINVPLDKPVLFGLVVSGRREGNKIVGGNQVAVGETSYGPSTFAVSSGATPAAPASDTTPPAKVTNLTLLTGCFAEDGGTFKISSLIRWTAPGDDGNTGMAARYDIRYRLGPDNNITSDNYDGSTLAPGNPTPKTAGSSEAFAFLVLGQSQCKISIALTALDEASNRSEMSNEVNNY